MKNKNEAQSKRLSLHGRRVKKAIIDTFFNGYTTRLTISPTRKAWYSCGNIFLFKNIEGEKSRMEQVGIL
jgi:hypothetical protein